MHSEARKHIARQHALQVGLGERSYPICIHDEHWAGLAEQLQQLHFPRRIAVVTNGTVAPLYASSLEQALSCWGAEVCCIELPDGEAYKTLATVQEIYDALLAHHFDRHCGLVALGGGVVGDMVGFAAATYLRGVPWVQVPTTLLAQVDSSVGGKTGVNLPQGKNLVGAFYQPRLVWIDVTTLATLPLRELRAGLAEVVKYGVIHDADFFAWLEKHAEPLLQLDYTLLAEAVRRACQIKADIVEKDETEQSIRAWLNYGHTLGHAVEQLSGYQKWRHGEAVAMGMAAAMDLAVAWGYAGDADRQRLRRLLQRLGLPCGLPHYAASAYLEVLKYDKKVAAQGLQMILNEGIGKARIVTIEDPAQALRVVLPVGESGTDANSNFGS